MKRQSARIGTEGGAPLETNPFASLQTSGLPQASLSPAPPAQSASPAKPIKRGRLELRREKAGRGGKTVTTVRGEGFLNICPAQIDGWLKSLKSQLGCGGAREGKVLEFQGDCRDHIETFFTREGFRVVRAGG